MPFVPTPCPNCHAILRASALRCWRCGLDLVHPEDGPAPADERVPAEVLPPEDPEEVGPCPANLLTRLLDPRLSPAELDRSVRGYALIPFRESYYRIGALLVGEPFTHGIGWLRAWGSDPVEASVFLSGGDYAYCGAPGPLILGMVAWTAGLLVVTAYLAASARWPHALMAVPLALLYVVLVVLSKAVRVAFARARYVRRMGAGHLGED